MKKFEGVIPALVTPLNADETVRVEVLQTLIEYLLKKDADGFYIGGATGEGLALRREQRMILAEESIRQVGGRAPCIVQVAATDFGEAIALAKHAEAVGADAISATPPLFFGYGEEEVYQYYKTLAEAVHIPMMIYYNPAAGFTVNADFAARMFEVDNITAIKWTSSDYYGMLRLKDLTHGEMNILNGPDEMLLMGLNAGADGGIGTTYNFQLDTIKSVYTNFRAGDLAAAQAAQTEANRAIAVLKRYAIIPATKALLAGMGFAVGDATFPMKRYSDAEKQEILSAFRALGFSV
jgi:N-acetylneuraminate lyase